MNEREKSILFSTRGRQIGFHVVFEDGSSISELDATWDEVSRTKRIRKLSVMHFPTRHEFAILDNFRVYFFCNEGAHGLVSGLSAHTAKIVGGRSDDGKWHEARLDFAGTFPTGSKRILDECPVRMDALRDGL